MTRTHTILAALTMLVGAVLLLSVPARDATAHHVVSDYGIAGSEPVSYAQLDLRVRNFDFGADSTAGTAVLAIPRLEWAPVSLFSVGLYLPTGVMELDNGESRRGVGDLGASLRFQLVTTPHGRFLMSGGLGASLPTGLVDAGFGTGHVDLSPFLTVSSAPVGGLILHGSVIQHFSLEGGGHGDGNGESGDGHSHDHHDHDHGSSGDKQGAEGPHGALIAPHETIETRLSMGVSWLFEGPGIFVSAKSGLVAAWSRADVVGPLDLGAEAGWRFLDDFTISAGVDAPVLGPDRFDWRVGMSLRYGFDASLQTEPE